MFPTKNLVKNNLNPVLWNNNVLKHDVQDKLLNLANEIISKFEIKLSVIDIIFTGSNANYNWNIDSDIDLHIIVEFSKGTKGELEKIIAAQTTQLLKKTHNITINNIPVEIYIQSSEEDYEHIGIWSVKFNKWLQPPPALGVHIISENIQNMAYNIAKKISLLELDFLSNSNTADIIYKKCENLKNEISENREKYLHKYGLFSDGNLVFKLLRSWGYLERLKQLKINAFDKIYSK